MDTEVDGWEVDGWDIGSRDGGRFHGALLESDPRLNRTMAGAGTGSGNSVGGKLCSCGLGFQRGPVTRWRPVAGFAPAPYT